MSDFLAALRDRVLIFDGAFGTWVQDQDLGPDDFGGPELEGCNEHVVLTRPDVIAEMHREFFDVGVDAVETATFGSFPIVLAEYGIPEKTYELNETAARIAKEVASGFATPERPRWVVDGRTHYDLTPDELAEAHDRFTSELGVNIVGGCCGTTPEHLRRVVETIGNRAPLERHPVHEPGCASIYSHVPFHQETSFLVVGERTNTNGSKKFRESMLEEDWETCVQMAREQVKEGSHVLDVCVDYVGRDGTADMDEIASRFATQASIPLVFDSTEPQVMEAGLQHFGGKPILNSANLEDGDGEGARLDRVFKLARDYGAAVVCMAIDEEGQARTTDWKFRIAKRIYEMATERYGIEPTDLVFDCLTFPLSTGQDDLRRDAIETMEAIKRVKAELPGASTILGVSNVSFGLKPAARHVLNSVFLHECVEAGLDAAIVHAARIMPMHTIDDRIQDVALDLVYDRRREGYDPLSELLSLFEGVEANAVEQEDRS